MRNLLNFLMRYATWMLFGFYVVIGCAMLFTTNPYQHHVYLTSAGALTSTVYDASSSVSSYFSLRDINDDLQRRNAELENEVLGLREELGRLRELQYADTMRVDSALQRYNFILAPVINNSTNRTHNYITIHKGALDGVQPEMGVVDQNGVVGIVNIVGPHTARVISLLNPHQPLSCKIKGHEQVGSLVWDGKNPRTALLEELPSHATFNKGDTVITSGFSSSFPVGIPVGRVIGTVNRGDGNFSALKVQLFTDFTTLSTVRVIKDRLSRELEAVEKDIDPGED